MCDGLMMGPLLSSALEPFKRQVGTASSVAQSYRFFSAAVIALIASSVSNAHRNVLHVGTAAMAVLCVVIFFAFVYGADYSQFAKRYVFTFFICVRFLLSCFLVCFGFVFFFDVLLAV